MFDFELTAYELASIDALDTGIRGGPEPVDVTLEAFVGRSPKRDRRIRPPTPRCVYWARMATLPWVWVVGRAVRALGAPASS
jgi:hypothetical protein